MHARILAIFVAAIVVVMAISFEPSAQAGGGGNKKVEQVYVNATAVIESSWGTFKAMLYEEGAPITTANFIKLSNEGFYNGTMFHRVIDGFVVQGGDPLSKDNNPYNDGTGGSNETIPLEINETLTHIDGALGMARSSEPDSASSQFYICDGPQHGLDGDYAVFGVVIEGMDVVQKISSCETYGNKRPLLKDHPVDDISINVYIIPGYYENATKNGTSSGNGGSASGALPGPGAAYIVLVIAIVTICGYARKKKI